MPKIAQADAAFAGGGRRDLHRAGAGLRSLPHGQGLGRRGARDARSSTTAAREAWRHGVRSAKWQSVAWSSVGLAVQVSFLAVLGIGGARVASGAISVSHAGGLPALPLLSDRPGVEARRGGLAVPGGLGGDRADRGGGAAGDGGPRPAPADGPGRARGRPSRRSFEDVTFRYRDGSSVRPSRRHLRGPRRRDDGLRRPFRARARRPSSA